MGMLSGKRALVIGVASKLSIAYGIADALHREGCDLAFTYQNDKLKDRVLGLQKVGVLLPLAAFHVMSQVMQTLTMHLLSWLPNGMAWISSSTAWLLRLAINSRDDSWMSPLGKGFTLRMMSRLTA